MPVIDELVQLGYSLSFSEACPIKAWGKWHSSFKKADGSCVKGYGETEEEAFKYALNLAIETVRVLEENKGLTKH